MPRGHALHRRKVREEVVGLGSLQGDRPQAQCAVPAQQAGEQPLAEAAVRVVEDHPAVLGGRSDRVPGEVGIARHS